MSANADLQLWMSGAEKLESEYPAPEPKHYSRMSDAQYPRYLHLRPVSVVQESEARLAQRFCQRPSVPANQSWADGEGYKCGHPLKLKHRAGAVDGVLGTYLWLECLFHGRVDWSESRGEH